MKSSNHGKDFTTRLLTLSSWPGALAAIILFVLLLTLLYPEAVFQDKVFVSPDSIAPAGFIDYVRAQGGGSALWNPFIFAGMPAFASLSYNPGLYPVNAILRFFIAHLGAAPLTWLLFHYLWAGLGIFLLLRWRGVRGWLAWIAGAWFLLLPSQVAIGAYGHGSKVMTLAWIPWVLLFVDRLVAGRTRLLSAGLLSVSLAGMLLTAHIQVTYYGLMIMGVFAVFRLIQEWRKGGMGRVPLPLGLGILAILLAVGSAVILYLPVQEYSHHSIRGVGDGGGTAYDYATAWSLAPSEWGTFILPSSSGFGEETYFGRMPMTNYPNYLGLIPLLAALLLFMTGPRKGFDIFFAAVIVFATIVAAGKYFPLLYRPLFNWLPWFNSFRVPVMILILQQLALAILLARGVERALQGEVACRKFRLLLGAGAMVLILALLVGSGMVEGASQEGLAQKYGAQLARVSQTQARGFVGGLTQKTVGWFKGDILRGGLLLLLLLGAVELHLRRARSAITTALVVAMVALALLADLFPLDQKILDPASHWEQRRHVNLWGEQRGTATRLPAGTLRFLKENLEGQRFYALPGSAFGSNGAAAEGLASFGGYHAAKLAVADSVLKALPTGGRVLLDRFAVRYVVNPQPGSLGGGFREVLAAEEVVHESSSYRPRLSLAENLVIEDPAASRTRLMSGSAPPGVLYLDSPPGLKIGPGQGVAGEILSTTWGLDEVECRVNLNRAAVLVLADMIYPGWGVEVDGQERDLRTADGFFRAVSLDKGEHKVRFFFLPPHYDRLSAIRGWAVTLMVCLIGAGLLGVWRERSRGTGEMNCQADTRLEGSP